MTYGSFVLRALLVLAPGPADAADGCTARPIDAPELMGRGFEVTLPDGRWLAVIGHEHGPRPLQGQLLDNLLDPKMNAADLARANKKLRSQLTIAQTHFTADLAYLKKLVATTAKPLTIWAEGEADSTGVRIEDIRTAADRRKIHGTRVDDDLLLASGSPAVYLAAGNKLPRNVKVEGLEKDVERTRADYERSKEIRAGAWSLSRIAEESIPASQAAWATYRKLDDLVKAGRTDEILNFDLGNANADIDALKVSPEATSSLKKRLASYLMERKSALRRDVSNVDGMVASRTGGVFLVGKMHLGSSVALLTERCKKLTAPAPAAAAPGDPGAAK